ncbi:peptidase domain-containing ABC transporter [Neolewinella lacunae]|uniref:Peptidase domain-containing ABC transporter n=1 Tax=Neolewinella lacunae TaxID=1517758 RepID=A0A923PQ55_9BACT|nr:peptidase domain-containing ABC transporter [Neolewinella lacunae]MBC6995373.1 peptidase domain-containing ABC transporter [Neolewinella lacunae]MDN3633085.1 peptidase domain-containing ABC transporter [Neolewinella lacunae]
MLRFTYYQQLEEMDCGAACLRMVARHYGRYYNLEHFRERTRISREGVSLLGISEGAESVGFQTLGLPVSLEQLENEIPLPCILPWNEEHFVVLYRARKGRFYIADPDPAIGKREIGEQEMIRHWATQQNADGSFSGNVLVLETTPDFFAKDREGIDKSSWKYILDYFRNYSILLWQFVAGLVLASILQILLPFLLKNMVDFGIVHDDFDFIKLVVLAQGILLLSTTALVALRRYTMLHIGGRVNVSLVSDYIRKLTRLPLEFFDSRSRGDLLQRINDHERLQNFLTGPTLIRVFSIFNFLAFAVVLALWSTALFVIFIIGMALNILWVSWLEGRKRDLDFKFFEQSAAGKEQLMEIIDGMQEIKQGNAARQKRWAWERQRAGLYRTRLKLSNIDQWQRTGGTAINQLKNLIITLVAAKAVLEGDLTLGTLVAIHYILAQLDSPIDDFTEFARGFRESLISLERMNEIHNKADEEDESHRLSTIPGDGSLELNNVGFHYNLPNAPQVLKGLTAVIPAGKTTAIVGSSGSGKSTLLKLLQGFYQPTEGEILLGGTNLATIDKRYWRSVCGVVSQDGYIFSDTIARNIAFGEAYVDQDRLLRAVKITQIERFIDSLPKGYATVVGEGGVGLSKGQQQRLLIARALYHQPKYLFLDEATTGLNAFTEVTIMDDLFDYMQDATIVIVAHRHSTFERADHIIVINEGVIVEQGTHKELMGARSNYFRLVRNQTLLGN